MMKRMIPSIFYEDLQDGLDLFVNCLAFTLLYRDDVLAVVLRDNAKVFLVLDAQLAARERIELTMETFTIEEDFENIRTHHPSFLHSEMSTIKATSWGGREFAVCDATGVCVLIRQLDE